MTGQEEDYLSFLTDNAPQERLSTSLAPDDITRSTFLQLLQCYPDTVKEVYTRKIIKKSQPRQTKKERKRAITENNLPPERTVPQKQLENSLAELLELDKWRYEELPVLLKARQKEQLHQHHQPPEKQAKHQEGIKVRRHSVLGLKSNNESPTAGMYLKKEELVKLMDWKLHHGYFRPTLMGMVKTNQESLVHKTTLAAFNSIPHVDPIEDLQEAFPKISLDTLTKALRGIGPATASLILSVATKDDKEATSNEAPFYSDELFMWLCLKIYPEDEGDRHEPGEQCELAERMAEHIRKNGELNVKYSAAEYEKVWTAVQKLRGRLNHRIGVHSKTKGNDEEEEKSDNGNGDDGDGERRIFTSIDIEKVAYVLRYGHVPEMPPREIKIVEREKELKERKAAAIAAGASTLTKKQQKKLKKEKKPIQSGPRTKTGTKRKLEERGKGDKESSKDNSNRTTKKVRSK